jgi:DNA-binding response OmpR family regulator
VQVEARAVILVVEDDDLVRTSMCATLTLMGFLPHGAETVDAALKILGTESVDAMVLDVRIPDPSGQQRSGLSLLKFLRATAEYSRVPVLVFTGMTLSAADEEVVRTHNGHLFYKPQQYSVLIEHLTGLLGAAR